MFKVGDRVVCVKNHDEGNKFNLEIGQVYTISQITIWDSIRLILPLSLTHCTKIS